MPLKMLTSQLTRAHEIPQVSKLHVIDVNAHKPGSSNYLMVLNQAQRHRFVPEKIAKHLQRHGILAVRHMPHHCITVKLIHFHRQQLRQLVRSIFLADHRLPSTGFLFHLVGR